jgi:phospholipid/cholesterol/gamma-HCH transport system substrate-binding protein
MPHREQVSWAQLRVGILVVAALVIMATGIFFISGQIGFIGSSYTLKAYFSAAEGLREGAQVRLAGIPAGNVEKLDISPYPEPQRAVEVIMRIDKSYQREIHSDSQATIQTAGLLGESYVDITRGSPGEAVLTSGGIVKTREEADIKEIVQNTNAVITNLRGLSDKLNDITNQIQGGKGSFSKLLYDPGFYNHLNQTAASAQQLLDRVNNGEGTLGKLVADDTLYQKAVATVDHVNEVMDQVQHGNGSMAKFLNDPGVYNSVNQAVKKTNMLLDNIHSGKGTLGKLATDDQLYVHADSALARLDVITTRIEQGQGTLGKLSTDPTLYNNLAEGSSSMRDFLAEFKKNPKKYLSIKLHLF